MSSATPQSAAAATRRNRYPTSGTVVFIDMAGFTALTDAHGDEQAVGVVDRFESAVESSLSDPAALIKFIGDAAMLAFETTAEAVASIAAIMDRWASDGFPELRVGLHYGPLTWRAGDAYGATVNLASRVAGHAAGNQVLATASSAANLPAGSYAPVGAFTPRGTAHPVQLVEVKTGAAPSTVDPVCQMRLTRGQGVATVVHDGDRWELCSLTCARRFTTNPNLYLAQLRQPTPPPPSTGLPPGLIG
jgi:adenylate cyclase